MASDMLLFLLLGVAVLGFVVVSDLEGALLVQCHPGRQGLGDEAVQFSKTLFIIGGEPAAQYVQMLLREVDEGGEHKGRGGRRVENIGLQFK